MLLDLAAAAAVAVAVAVVGWQRYYAVWLGRTREMYRNAL